MSERSHKRKRSNKRSWKESQKQSQEPIVNEKDVQAALRQYKAQKYINKLRNFLNLNNDFDLKITVEPSHRPLKVLSKNDLRNKEQNFKESNVSQTCESSWNDACKSVKTPPASNQCVVLDIDENEDIQNTQPVVKESPQLVKEIKYYEVSKKSFSVLDSKDWIGDEIINWMVKLLTISRSQLTCSKNKNFLDTCWIVKTYVFSQMQKRMNAGRINEIDSMFARRIKEHKKKEPIRTIIFPIYSDNHWFAIILHLDTKIIEVYDSLQDGAHNMSKIIKVFKNYIKESKWIREQILNLQKLSDSHKNSDNLDYDFKFWNKEKSSSFNQIKLDFKVEEAKCPQQKDSYDCGVYLWIFLYYLYQGVQPPMYMETSKIRRYILKRSLLYGDVKFIKERFGKEQESWSQESLSQHK